MLRWVIRALWASTLCLPRGIALPLVCISWTNVQLIPCLASCLPLVALCVSVISVVLMRKLYDLQATSLELDMSMIYH